MTATQTPHSRPAAYTCAACGTRWSYEAVRYVALCPACGGGLLRVKEPAGRAGSERRRGRRSGDGG